MSSSRLLRRACELSPIRVLIVDDSAVARAALSRMIVEAPRLVLAGSVNGARQAIDWLGENRADVVLLDIQMPALDGLAALPELLAVSDGARVLVVSTLAEAGARATIEALALGAADTLAKPAPGGLGRQFATTLADKIMRLDEVPAPNRGVSDGCYPLRTMPLRPVTCLAIGASTGGLHALAAFFAALPDSFDAPALVTQHLPPVFMPFFAEQLAMLSGRPARVAKTGDALLKGAILVAPGTLHLGCVRIDGAPRAALLDHVAVSRCCPSVDPMFGAVAATFGSGALAVMLTGMGRDGAAGAAAVARAGGTVVAQDAVTSAVWGMPGTVVGAGLATLVGPPAALAAYAVRCGSAA